MRGVGQTERAGCGMQAKDAIHGRERESEGGELRSSTSQPFPSYPIGSAQLPRPPPRARTSPRLVFYIPTYVLAACVSPPDRVTWGACKNLCARVPQKVKAKCRRSDLPHKLFFFLRKDPVTQTLWTMELGPGPCSSNYHRQADPTKCVICAVFGGSAHQAFAP